MTAAPPGGRRPHPHERLARQVAQVNLPTVSWGIGYDAAEVDAFLARLVGRLREGITPDLPEQVLDEQFRARRRGRRYAELPVDEWLDGVVAALRQALQRQAETPQDQPAPPVDAPTTRIPRITPAVPAGASVVAPVASGLTRRPGATAPPPRWLARDVRFPRVTAPLVGDNGGHDTRRA